MSGRSKAYLKNNDIELVPECKEKRDLERQKLKAHNRRRRGSIENQEKQERLAYLVRYHGIYPESEALNRAERTMKAFELKAIRAADEAFHRAVSRNPEKATLPYFFGILRNLQQERNDAAYKNYCHQRYNEKVMLDLKQQQEKIDQPDYSIENVISILINGMRAKISFEFLWHHYSY